MWEVHVWSWGGSDGWDLRACVTSRRTGEGGCFISPSGPGQVGTFPLSAECIDLEVATHARAPSLPKFKQFRLEERRSPQVYSLNLKWAVALC